MIRTYAVQRISVIALAPALRSQPTGFAEQFGTESNLPNFSYLMRKS